MLFDRGGGGGVGAAGFLRKGGGATGVNDDSDGEAILLLGATAGIPREDLGDAREAALVRGATASEDAKSGVVTLPKSPNSSRDGSVTVGERPGALDTGGEGTRVVSVVRGANPVSPAKLDGYADAGGSPN